MNCTAIAEYLTKSVKAALNFEQGDIDPKDQDSQTIRKSIANAFDVKKKYVEDNRI